MWFTLSRSVDIGEAPDFWEWLPDTAEGYSVRGAYDLDLLTTGDDPLMGLPFDLVWHPQVPFKVSVFAWQLIRDRLPTKANLATRGVVPTDDIFCVFGCVHVETADHLFLSCTTFASLWQQVRDWIGVLGVDHNIITDHLVQFTHLAGVGKAKRSFLQLIWLLSAWVLWSERNTRIFNNFINLVPQLLDKVKLLSLGWLKANKVVFVYDTQRWWVDPLACLGLAT
ncbi:uncharacterized protein [Medicago truncatula]|uniref:uncharacterized protein n=1 Tax=Medicago truncatula TaxID=3880 RepID=UPI000D2F28C1|nr:uncharacterized protein LOC112420160 [Medicago truncatula]